MPSETNRQGCRSHNGRTRPDCDTGILASARGPRIRCLRELTGRDAGLTTAEPELDSIVTLASLPVPGARRNRCLRKLTGRDAGLTMAEPDQIVTLASLPVTGAQEPVPSQTNRQGCRSHNGRTRTRLDCDTGILASARGPRIRCLRKLTGRDAGLTMPEPEPDQIVTLASLPVPGARRNRCLRKLTGRDAGLTMAGPEPDSIVTLASLPVRSGLQP